jgi:hypothetical protein
VGATDSSPHSRYRAERVVQSFGTPSGEPALTVFVGLYNASPYFEHLIRQIEGQSIEGARWLFVDNDSGDETWQLVTSWAATSPLDITLVRNGFNLGATGSIFVNLDLVSTPWVAFMHQDDIYLPHHFSSLSEAAAASSAETVGIFSDMGRADENGRSIGAFPPAIWLVPDMQPATLFLSLLRNHCVPWPTLAVRTDRFRASEAPWHSTAFPDTEITMRMVASGGQFVHLDHESMRYRDNLSSESRSIDDRERKFGATVSLFRVIASTEFATLALSLDESERAAFAEGFRSATLARLGDTERASLVIAGALERLDHLWQQSEPSVLTSLGELYRGLGSVPTSSLLGRMAKDAGGSGEIDDSAVTTMDTTGLLGAPRKDSAVAGLGAVQRVYERTGFLIPYRIRRGVARLLIRRLTRSSPQSAWNFEWR